MSTGPAPAGVLHPEVLRGQVAVVTGAAKGIGAAVALELARAGAELVLYDLAEPGATADAVRALGGEASAAVLDVTDRDTVGQALGALPRIDVLVTSAGVYGEPIPIVDMADAEMDRVLGVNVKGALWTIRAALPALRRDGGGRVVCLGSAAGEVGGVASGPQYVASKGAVHAMVKWLARTEAVNGVAANAVAPGAVDTDMIAGKGYDGGYCPLGRLGTPQDVAAVVAFLCTPGAGYMTGTVVDVNGGFHMG
ncbi:3-oxoacyl-ACP reductase FabG [Pseudonocardia petroleophila]|uniref:SDR family NAD(P)-dependent oxidoreductase n=1 Tax=Pseudonocardia petroleophila TaxID=37331 RepID=UPI002102F3C8|nr:SDR family oxidoreductase [Pseudonocardia petroleophila]